MLRRTGPWTLWGVAVLLFAGSLTFATLRASKQDEAQVERFGARSHSDRDRSLGKHVDRLIAEGQRTFRFDTFGDEVFWEDALKLHQAIAGAANGGVGPGLSPRQALELGLKVDVEALPGHVRAALRARRLNLDDSAVTLVLLDLDAVVGLKGFQDRHRRLTSIGLTCAVCHSTVDDSFAPGIGRRLDGWANRDLNIGVIAALAPDLSVVATLVDTTQDIVRDVLRSLRPGPERVATGRSGAVPEVTVRG
jgi:hypothetical protein